MCTTRAEKWPRSPKPQLQTVRQDAHAPEKLASLPCWALARWVPPSPPCQRGHKSSPAGRLRSGGRHRPRRLPRSQTAKLAQGRVGAGFMSPSNAKLVIPGNMNDDLESAVKDSDWIIEAIKEDADWKRSWFAKIDAVKKPGATTRIKQHLDHSVARPCGRALRRFPPELPDHALLQPAALHAPA